MINEIVHYYEIGLNFDEIENVTGVPVKAIKSVISENGDMIQKVIPSRREVYELVKRGYISREKGATIAMFDKISYFNQCYQNWLLKVN